MKKAWSYVGIPPLLGLRAFLLVKAANSVSVPTQEEIDAAVEREREVSGGSMGLSNQELRRRLEAIARGEIPDLSQVSPKSNGRANPDGAPARRPKQESEATKLIKQYNEGNAQNRRAYIYGIWAGIVVGALGYVVVVYYMYSQLKTPPKWQEAIAARQAASPGAASEEPLVEHIVEPKAPSGPAVEPGSTGEATGSVSPVQEGDLIFVDENEAKSEFEVEGVIEEKKTGKGTGA